MTALAPSLCGDTLKYLAIARIALEQRLHERAALIARAVIYVVVLVACAGLWRELGAPTEYVWYLAVAQWIALSQPRTFFDVEHDVQSGEIAHHLLRPTPYVTIQLAAGAGEMLLAMAMLGTAGGAAAALLTGGPPASALGLVLAVVLGPLAGAVLLACNALIGLATFWLRDGGPPLWLWQQALFVLGGAFAPLSLYPEWLRTVALCSPFSALIGGPAGMVLAPDAGVFLLLALELGACLVLALYALAAVSARIERRVACEGEWI